MNTDTEEIKARLDIVELIQSYIRLERSGVNWRACCPFHSEKTPSFFVSPTRQTWHCFGGCGEGGDIFSFVQKIEGVDFREALETLARRAGVDIHHEDPTIRSEKTRLLVLCDEAAKYFAAALSYYPAAGAYLTRRGLQPETIKNFRIGFAPAGWRNLVGALGKKGFRPEEIERAGLAIKSDRGFYDRFRSRVIFPIADASGRIVGFGGRIFEAAPAAVESGKQGGGAQDGGAKYINSPQTPIYDKSRILYAFDKAKKDILKENTCIIVEGYMDAVMSHQAGVTHAIAVSGTALTNPQIQMIRRLADTLVSSFDADEAGTRATKRSLDLAAGAEFNRLVAVVPKDVGKDPADIVLCSPDLWKEIVANAKPVVDFYFEKALSSFDKTTPSGKTAIARDVLSEVRHLANDIERSHWIKKLARELDVEENSIWVELSKLEDTSQRVESVSAEHREVKSRRRLLEERILGILLLHPDVTGRLKKFLDNFPYPFFSDMTHQHIFTMIMKGSGATADAAVVSIKNDAYVRDLMFQTEMLLSNIEEQERDREFGQAVVFLAEQILLGECQRLARDIAEAERSVGANLDDLVGQYREISLKKEKLNELF